MNKKIITIVLSTIHLFFFSIGFSSQSSQSTQLILWGLKNPIAEIPQRKQTTTITKENEEKEVPLSQSFKQPLHAYFKLKQSLPSYTATDNHILLICKANDTGAFLEIYSHKTPLIPINAYSAPGKKGNTPLHIACKKNNTEIVKRLLLVSHDINALNDEQETPLHVACKNSSQESVLLLCAHNKIKINRRNKNGFTALHILCIHNHYLLLKRLFSILHYDHQEDIFITYHEDMYASLLNLATAHNCIETVEFLLTLPDNIINPNNQEADGSTPLHTAASNRCYPIIQLLLKHKDIDPNRYDTTIIKTRYKKITEWDNECSAIISWDKPHGIDAENNTPLHLACYNNDIKAVALLLEHTETVPLPFNNNKETPLHIVCEHGFYELFLLFIDTLREKIEDPNNYLSIRTAQGATPFYLACANNHGKIVAQLLTINCNPNIKDSRTGSTPLHIAARKGHCSIVELLLENNTGTSFLDYNCNTPYQLACKFGKQDVVSLFERYSKK